MIKNYRRIGATRASYLGALGSGKSQGGEVSPSKNVAKKELILFYDRAIIKKNGVIIYERRS